ncbi:MAG: YeiH family protein [Thermovenabulum sp.]|uniref:YeiH family protein n=1 Tax=Thermovenabulum sp. TaxID=3100335 RepID=UPI003C7CB542
MVQLWITEHLPGLIIVTAVTVASVLLQSTTLFSKTLPLSSLIIAIIIGMIIKNFIPMPSSTQKGIRFCAKKILRLAIIFLGFKLSISQVLKVGPSAFITILVSSTSTIIFTVWLGRIMGVPLKRALLLGSGVSICGASAVAAVDAIIQSKEEDAAFAIGAVTLFGTIFMFLYPALHGLLDIPDMFYALWAGSSIHEVAQVAAASVAASGQFKAMASTVKMIRVLFIIPLTLILTFLPWNNNVREKGKITIPWFAILFFVMVLVNSFAGLPKNVVMVLITFDNWIMTAAMAGLGLDLSFSSMVNIGARALVLGAVSSAFISILSAIVIGIIL